MLGHCYSISIHKCVSEDTYICLDGGMKRIKDLHTGDKPIYQSDYNVYGRNGIKKCVQVFKGIEEDSIKITTRQGFTLEGSHRHPILVADAEGKEIWKKLPEIQVGDRLVMRKGMKVAPTEYVSELDKLIEKIKLSNPLYSVPSAAGTTIKVPKELSTNSRRIPRRKRFLDQQQP